MPTRNQPVLDFLSSRRSRISSTLQPPVPARAEVQDILQIASRVPDHGKLVPWRFVVLEREDCIAYGDALYDVRMAQEVGEKRAEMAANNYRKRHLVIAVIESVKTETTIPQSEQTFAVGGVCFNLLATLLASGWGAQWLSGVDADLEQRMLGVAPHERVAGMIHVGTGADSVTDRPRPDMDAITTWGLQATA
ncbi:MAG: nitroreductase family protein [Pseudomonadota bacterium]